MVFAEPPDVATAYEGSLPTGSEVRVQYLLDTVSARLRLLLPDLEDRIAADTSGDLALLAKDVVVQSVIRRLPGDNQQQTSSQTQQAGPFATTLRFTTDKSGTFPDADLDLLRGTAASSMGALGTIRLGMVDWANQ